MPIDAFCHIAPKEALNAYLKTQIPQLVRFIDATIPADDERFVDDEARIRYMDKYGIDIEILSFNPPIWDTVPADSLMRLVRLANDSLAKMVGRHPDRMVAVASIPVPSEEYLDELDRSIQELGMKGVIIYSNIRGKPLDSLEFIPFYEKMVRYDLPLLLHPTSWQYYDWVHEYRLVNIFGWPFDSTIGASRLVFGGILDRFPNLKIIIHHLGGMIPYFSERIRGFYDEALMHPHVYGSHLFPISLKRHPIEYFKSLYGDTVVNGSLAALKCGYEFFGADHTVYATDYPFGPDKGELWTKAITKSVHDLEISEEAREKILVENSRRLFKL